MPTELFLFKLGLFQIQITSVSGSGDERSSVHSEHDNKNNLPYSPRGQSQGNSLGACENLRG